MTRLLCLPLILTLALALRAAPPPESGVPIGKRPGPYSFLVATGPQRGQLTCYVCEQHEANKPAVIVFSPEDRSVVSRYFVVGRGALPPV